VKGIDTESYTQIKIATIFHLYHLIIEIVTVLILPFFSIVSAANPADFLIIGSVRM
jgi:hypothetical protein